MEEAKRQLDCIDHSGYVLCFNGCAKWKKAQTGKLTVSRDPLVSIRSVVAVTLPPVLCKSHCIDRLSTCGNIVAI